MVSESIGKKRTSESRPDELRKEAKIGGGLNVELHPLLQQSGTQSTNYLKSNGLRFNGAPGANPYIDQTNITIGSSRHRPLQLNPKGKFIAEADEIRAKEAEQLQVAKKQEELLEKGVLPNINTQENCFKLSFPPLVEWWDVPYLRTRLYREFYDKKKEFFLDDEQALVSVYVQHPVAIPPPSDGPVEQKIYLTKDEMRRKRRNERQIKHKEKQDRIKLGLDPPPPPKVKLANLMNVLTDEAIKDPTGVERRVRQEIQDRYDKHMAENEARKPTREQKLEQVKESQERDLLKGLMTTVYKVKTLSDGQQFYKVDMNAKQLGLFGMALINPRFCLVIVEGGAKSIRFFKKLMMNRIKWDKLATQETIDNGCVEVWEGEVLDFSFKKWSPMYTNDDDDAYKVLKKFGHENYWRQAFNL